MSTDSNSFREERAQSQSHEGELVVNDTADIDDPRWPLIRALRLGGWALAGLTILSLMGWGAASGLPGIWAVLMGAAIGGGFVLLTALSVLLTSGSSPSSTMVVVLGGWLVKLVVLIIVLSLLRELDFFDHLAFGVTTIIALVVVLGVEAWGVITSRATYVG